MPRSGWLHAGAAVALGTLAAYAYAGEMPFKKVPKAVQATVRSYFKDARVVGASSEKGKDHKLVYEVSLRKEDRNIDVTLNPKGEMISVEREITFSDLPDSAATALNEKYPGARYGIVETVSTMEKGKERLAYYEARLMDADKQAWAVEFTGNGTILQVEKKEGLEEDED